MYVCVITCNSINSNVGDASISRLNRVIISKRILYLLTNTVTLSRKPLDVLFSYAAIASVASSLIFLSGRPAAFWVIRIFYYFLLYIFVLLGCVILHLLPNDCESNPANPHNAPEYKIIPPIKRYSRPQ